MAFPDSIQEGGNLLNDELITGLNYAWQAWSPSASASGSMTYTSVSYDVVRYRTVGKAVGFELNFTGTTGGTASTELRITPPVTPLDNYVAFPASARDGAWEVGWAYTESGKIVLRNYDGSNWSLGANVGGRIAGIYSIA